MQTRKSAAQWAELISAWEASGVSADVFAREHGIVGSTLRWWRTELARRAQHQPRRRSLKGPSSTPAISVALARVVRPGHGGVPSTAGAGVSVVVGSARIVVDHGFDGALLREVVRALEESR